MTYARGLFLAALAALSLPAKAITPEELFTRTSPSIWFVYGADNTEKRVSQGSGVVVGPQRVVTNCHVVQGASVIFLRKENVIYIAKLEHRDAARDLCQLQVPNFTAPAVELGSSKALKVGQKVFALGNPKGLEVTLSDGLVSALRGPDGVDPIIQTTAPISAGSSGGGLFDEQGKLVGITTLQNRSGQNLNFAIPVDWVNELSERVKMAEEKKKEQLAVVRGQGVAYSPAAAGLPEIGATWKYRYTDKRFSNTQTFTFGVTGVEGWSVHETLTPQDATSSQVSKFTTPVDEMRFVNHRLGAGRFLLEFNPYLLARGEESYSKLSGVFGYPGNQSNPWKVTAQQLGWSEVTVPAGTFRALQVEFRGARAFNTVIAGDGVGRFVYRIWYAPEVGRYIKAQHESWLMNGSASSNEVVELFGR
jgi:serine protease Do